MPRRQQRVAQMGQQRRLGHGAGARAHVAVERRRGLDAGQDGVIGRLRGEKALLDDVVALDGDRLLGEYLRQIGGLVGQMEAAAAQLGHLPQPGRVRPRTDADHRHGDALGRQLLDEFRHALLLLRVRPVGQDDHVFHRVLAAGQRLGRRLQPGADEDAAAARAQLPHLGDGLVPVGGADGADDRVRPLVDGDERHLVEIVEQF